MLGDARVLHGYWKRALPSRDDDVGSESRAPKRERPPCQAAGYMPTRSPESSDLPSRENVPARARRRNQRRLRLWTETCAHLLYGMRSRVNPCEAPSSDRGAARRIDRNARYLGYLLWTGQNGSTGCLDIGRHRRKQRALLSRTDNGSMSRPSLCAQASGSSAKSPRNLTS
jgi:hypothetical protein